LGNPGFIIFAIFAGVGLVLDLKVQTKYTRGVRGAMEKSAKSRWIPAGLHPSVLTLGGLLLCVASAPVLYYEHDHWQWVAAAIIAFFVGSMLDVLDGSVARQNGKTTPLGKFMDSNTDRIGEAAVLIAFVMLFRHRTEGWPLLCAAVAIFASQAVSYARSTAEATGLQGKKPDSGLARRAERCTAILGAMVWQAAGWNAAYWIGLLAILCVITVGQRWWTAIKEHYHQKTARS